MPTDDTEAGCHAGDYESEWFSLTEVAALLGMTKRGVQYAEQRALRKLWQAAIGASDE
jgi:hypothetical protein